jgi:GAF domain-containing protein
MTTLSKAGPGHAGDQGPAQAALVPLLSDFLDDVATRTAARLVDVAGVAVTLKVADEPLTVGASNDLAADVDSIQYGVGVGPCLHSLREGVEMHVPDLGNDDRWEDYGPLAAARGAASCVSVPVYVAGRPAAVLKVYADRIAGISEEQRAIARSVAADVAGGIALAMHLSVQAHTLDDRASAMDTRRAIDLALGVLMERAGCDADGAFALLRQQSQASNVKLRTVAQQVLATVAVTPDGDISAPFKQHGARLT